MLKFSRVEPDIQTGDVMLFEGRSWFSRLIKLRTMSRYSHAGVAYRMRVNGHTRACVFEALEPHGVRLFPLDYYLEQGERIDWFSLTDPTVDREKVAYFVQQQWGKPYAWKQLAYSFSLTARWLRYMFRWKLSDRERGAFFCSELVTAALKHGGYADGDDLKSYAASPEDVSRLPCLQRRGTLTV